jgi:hypothetical protein
VLRIDLERLVELRQRLVWLVHVVEADAEIGADVGVLRIASEGVLALRGLDRLRVEVQLPSAIFGAGLDGSAAACFMNCCTAAASSWALLRLPAWCRRGRRRLRVGGGDRGLRRRRAHRGLLRAENPADDHAEEVPAAA